MEEKKRPYPFQDSYQVTTKKVKIEKLSHSSKNLEAILSLSIEQVLGQDLFPIYLARKEEFLDILKNAKLEVINRIFKKPDSTGIRLAAKLLAYSFENPEEQVVCETFNLIDPNMPTLHALVSFLALEAGPSCAEIELLNQCIEKRKEDISLKDCCGRIPLHYSGGQNKLVDLLINYGSDINCIDIEGNTPLYSAVVLGRYPIKLMSSTNINGFNFVNVSPLMLACFDGGGPLIDLLEELRKNNIDFDINSQNKLGKSVLLYAAEHGVLESVKALIEHQADMEIKDYDGFGLLHTAIFYEHKDLVKYLLEGSCGQALIQTPASYDLPTGASIFSLVKSKKMEKLLTKKLDDGNAQKDTENVIFFEKTSDILKNQQDIYQIKSIEWSYRGALDLEEKTGFWVENALLMTKFELDQQAFPEHPDSQLIIENFQDIYFLNPRHKHHQTHLVNEIRSNILPALKIPLIRHFFNQNKILMEKNREMGKTKPSIFIPWGGSISVFGKERNYNEIIEGIYYVLKEAVYSSVKQGNTFSAMIHEWAHRFIDMNVVDLSAFDQSFQALKKWSNDSFIPTGTVEHECFVSIKEASGYGYDEKEETCVRCLEIIINYGQEGLGLLKTWSPSIEEDLFKVFSSDKVAKLNFET